MKVQNLQKKILERSEVPSESVVLVPGVGCGFFFCRKKRVTLSADKREVEFASMISELFSDRPVWPALI